MYLVQKVEALHRGEHLAKHVANLCRGGYLPVEVPAINPYKKGIRVGLTGSHPHINFLVLEHDIGFVEHEVLRCVHKLWETWNGKSELLEELNLQSFEARGRDPRNKRFQVSASASEREHAKVREYNVCHDWRMCKLPPHITVGNSE